MALLEVNTLDIVYRVKSPLFGKPVLLRAVNDVTFSMEHGEIVGLGCQASMYAYERGEYETKNFARFMKAIGQPMSLKDLGLDTSDKGIKELVDCMMVVWGKRPEAHWPIIYDALQKIKE